LPEPVVVARALAKHYVTEAGNAVALHGLDAEIPAGGVTALVGVSGSGKSTFLRLLTGLESPTSGSLSVLGVAPATLRNSELRRFRRASVAFVAQRAADNLFPHLTIEEHVPGSDRGVFERLGIAHRMHARAAELSGGELARAAFAVALARRATLVLADEPTAELDDDSAALVLDAVADAARSGTTFVLATHDPGVLRIADDVLELRRPSAAAAAPPPSTPGEEVVLQCAGLSKSYDGTKAVDDASLTLHEGELSVVVGRSGSGKSTLLMLLGGWQTPDTGFVSVDPVWSQLAYVPQRFGLVPELTVHENVDLPARIAGVAGATDELLERLDLVGLANRLPAEISIGQQQRVAVARALSIRPRALLVDEPTSHQDAASAERVWSALAGAVAEGTGCLVATHEPDAGMRAHRAWSIDDGRLTVS
jgi:putative ABC transport system ATP-binding protein